MITCKNWVHVWLNEGFASYCEALWFEHLQGATKLRSYMESKDHPFRWSGPVLRDPDNMSQDYYFDNVVYDKGAWVLHMLRHVVGNDAFFQILKEYCSDSRYRFSAAETNDFKGICEAHYGSSLSWFFDEWLTRTDRLGYRWSSKSYRLGGAFNLTIVVDQTQATPYAMPVDCAVTTAAGTINTVLWVNGAHEEFHITLSDSALVVQLDPGHWILCDKTQVAPTEAVVPSVAYLAQNFPNPFNPATRIEFALSEPTTTSLRIYDAAGRLVRVLAAGPLSRGPYVRTWDGTDGSGRAVSSGVYFYRLDAGSFSQTRKMVLLR
jgi:hypothetical protein